MIPVCMRGIRGAERSQVLLSQSNTIVSSHLSSYRPPLASASDSSHHTEAVNSLANNAVSIWKAEDSPLHLCTFGVYEWHLGK